MFEPTWTWHNFTFGSLSSPSPTPIPLQLLHSPTPLSHSATPPPLPLFPPPPPPSPSPLSPLALCIINYMYVSRKYMNTSWYNIIMLHILYSMYIGPLMTHRKQTDRHNRQTDTHIHKDKQTDWNNLVVQIWLSYGLDEWFWAMFEPTWTWHNFTFAQLFMCIGANNDQIWLPMG